MKSVLLGCVMAGLLAVGAFLVLDPRQIPVTTAFTTEGVRLSNGH